MSNFKSGSGNLDFGGGSNPGRDEETDSDTDDSADGTTDGRDETEAKEEDASSASTGRADGVSSDAGTVGETESGRRAADGQPAGEAEGSSSTGSEKSSPEGSGSSSTGSSSGEYPYFVRRRNVGDERDTRLEIHVRDKVAEREGAFRNELAEQLETSEVSKTDAREFALLAAFRHPERVAELMREEGFGIVG